jgi:hypothetical protein|tara:strand:- start:299 stop:511 length:213 start_codon:yes stop_codon:yes gene_type:complete
MVEAAAVIEGRQVSQEDSGHGSVGHREDRQRAQGVSRGGLGAEDFAIWQRLFIAICLHLLFYHPEVRQLN